MTEELLREDPRDLDARVSAMVPGLTPPRPVPGAAVLVIGPWLAGVSSLTAALRRHMPEQMFVEPEELAPDIAPIAVVFAVSAVAPLAESDCAALDGAARHTDLVLGAVTKIDVHRDWRAVRSADADAVGAHVPRLRDMPWVGVAAAPREGRPHLDGLVAMLREKLSDDTLAQRNRLRAWENHLAEQIAAASAAADAESAALHRQRADILREARLSRSQRSIALRSRIQQARVQLGYFARNRCASVRTELSEDAASWGGLPWVTRRRADNFSSYVAGRVAEVAAEVDSGVTEQFLDIAAELALSAPPVPPAPPAPEVGGPGLTSRRLEMQLMMLLGAGFGLGVALAASRLFTGLAPGLTAVGAVAGGLLGLLLTVWVVGIRGLLHDRALLDRWVGRVTATLREDAEALVATRVLAAEVDFTGQAAAADERAAMETARRLDALDARLRERAVAAARAASAAEHRLPALRAALAAIRADLIIR
ncbi:hypothetical protein C6A86_000915 [Mycobacterium sp. ITM-2016-00316]|uniref:hypothetical protein n=1 Tax=Mycobacterium sp. ITM-2016-00316 TaxID=2099695 RepID=UPI0026A3F1E5|nr:hypothetical protein [Mycobacterium sp. ITM-2016-00316]WNG82306.1 hypothetical protein C6A86_000915 [Mycobacterium sp. ITM-2016-00316]